MDRRRSIIVRSASTLANTPPDSLATSRGRQRRLVLLTQAHWLGNMYVLSRHGWQDPPEIPVVTAATTTRNGRSLVWSKRRPSPASALRVTLATRSFDCSTGKTPAKAIRGTRTIDSREGAKAPRPLDSFADLRATGGFLAFRRGGKFNIRIRERGDL
jgi:hypothetical protein